MEKKKYEFVLGVSDLGGFEILEHTLNPRPHEFDAGVVFYVNDWSMGDGDGHPARYDSNLYKVIPESVYKKAIRIFRDTGNNMDDEAYDTKPLNRKILKDDYLYCGGYFFHVEDISDLTGKYWVKYFYYSYYDLGCEEESKTYQSLGDWMKDYDIEDIVEFHIIDKVIYERALNISKSGVLEVKDYLKNILTGN